MKRGSITVALVAIVAPASAQPGLTLPMGSVQGTMTFESDTSAHKVGDTVSIAPDLAIGIADDFTLSLIHSTYGRTGFRGSAGGGVCITEAGCARAYDNVGVEGLLSVVRGKAALAVDAGAYATSLDHELYVAKLGVKARIVLGRVTLAALPSVTIAFSDRDAMTPNRDRLWVPVSGMVAIGGGFSLGASTGLKAPLDRTFRDSYEIPVGALATLVVSPALAIGASWIEGKMFGGAVALPAGTDGLDSRAFQLWVTGTY